MIHYPHFAVTDLNLVNGYHVHRHGDDVAYEFEAEANLELCVARIVIRRPSRLRGCDLRFLRRTMGLTQAQFGEKIDRDAQTVARMEKDIDAPVERNVDTIARLEFATRFEPDISVAELSRVDQGLMDGATGPYFLRFEDGVWKFTGQRVGVQRLEKFRTEVVAFEVIREVQPVGGIIMARYLQQCISPLVVDRYDQGYIFVSPDDPANEQQLMFGFDNGSIRTITVPQAQNEFSYCVRH